MSMTRLGQYEEPFIFSNRLVKFVLGMKPNQNANHMLLKWCILAIYLLPIIVIQCYQSFFSDIKVKPSLSIIQRILSGICVCLTYSICYFRFDTMQQLFNYAKRDYQQYFGSKELCIFEKYTRQIKLRIIIFVSFFTLYGISLLIPSIFNALLHILGLLDDIHLTLPFPVNNIIHSGLLYYVLLIYQIIAIFAIFIICGVIYPSFLTAVHHACLQFSILMIKIRQPFNDKKFIENDWYDSSRQLEREWIVDIINRYARITKFVYLINNLTKIIFLIGTAFMMLLIFFDLLWMMQLSTILQNTRETVECFIIIFGSIVTIFIILYTGQTLINHSIAVYEELCQIPFYMLSIKSQKLLLFLIARSVKPCEISIGGIFVASNETFSSIIQKAFSFATVYYNKL